MVQAVSRSAIFQQSVFIDNQIAFEQQSTYRTIDQNDPDEVAYMTPFLDHMQAFTPAGKPLDGFCVLAFAAENPADYINNFPGVLVEFFTRLKINNLVLITKCKHDWKDYAFENNEKKQVFFSLLGGLTDGVGFRLNVNNLPEILPLFFNTHPDHPHINLIPPEGDLPINMLLCKDGNLHTLFDEKIHGQIAAAAEATGLYMGSFEVCQLYKNNQS